MTPKLPRMTPSQAHRLARRLMLPVYGTGTALMIGACFGLTLSAPAVWLIGTITALFYLAAFLVWLVWA